MFWQLVIGTVEDLHKLYPIVVPHTLTLDMKEVSLYQVHLPRPSLKILDGFSIPKCMSQKSNQRICPCVGISPPLQCSEICWRLMGQ